MTSQNSPVKEFVTKIGISVCSIIVMAGLGLGYNWVSGLSTIPNDVRIIQINIRRLDSITKLHESWLQQDYDSLYSIRIKQRQLFKEVKR